jgi:hypothetical protein
MISQRTTLYTFFIFIGFLAACGKEDTATEANNLSATNGSYGAGGSAENGNQNGSSTIGETIGESGTGSTVASPKLTSSEIADLNSLLGTGKTQDLVNLLDGLEGGFSNLNEFANRVAQVPIFLSKMDIPEVYAELVKLAKDIQKIFSELRGNSSLSKRRGAQRRIASRCLQAVRNCMKMFKRSRSGGSKH